MIKFWKFVPILIVLVLCLGLLLVPAVVGVSAGAGDLPKPVPGNATFLLPAEVCVVEDQVFAVDVTIYNPNSMVMTSAGIDLMISDTSKLSVTSIDEGDWPTPLNKGSAGTGEIWHNAAGSIVSPTITTDALQCVIHFLAGSEAGIVEVNFVPSGDESDTLILDPDSIDICDWGTIQDMTVKIGTPELTVNPSSLSFSGNVGGANPPNQTLEVCHSGAGTLDWSLTDGDTAWLSETPTSGSLAEDGCEDVTVSVDVTGMEAGDYSATITITGSPVVQVPVSLHIESAMVPIPGGPAGLSASALDISPQQVEPGEEVTISISVANTGGEAGDYDAVLYINGEVEDSQTVSLAAGTSKNVIFTVSKSQAGVYDVSVAGQSGQFEVVGGGFFGGRLGTGGIIAIVAVVIILVVAVVFILRGTRREV